MAECAAKSLDVVNGLVHCEVDLMKMLRELILQERKGIDKLRTQRYHALEDLDTANTRSMDLDTEPQEIQCIQQKEELLALIDRNIMRKQQYVAILSDIADDRKRNLDLLSKDSLTLMNDEMADLKML